MLSRDEVFAVLDGVADPEIPVLSVIDLGIVREVAVDAAERSVTITITPTYSGCPAMQAIEHDIVSALEAAGVASVRVHTTYSPAWTSDWIGSVARAKLAAYGIAPPGSAERELVPLTWRAEIVACPYCGGRETARRSDFGSTACKSIWFCRSCQEPFEQFKAI
jgi:ring-1,2-phenylacetyl-CoA epoxidase subunit PaaD